MRVDPLVHKEMKDAYYRHDRKKAQYNYAVIVDKLRTIAEFCEKRVKDNQASRQTYGIPGPSTKQPGAEFVPEDNKVQELAEDLRKVERNEGQNGGPRNIFQEMAKSKLPGEKHAGRPNRKQTLEKLANQYLGKIDTSCKQLPLEDQKRIKEFMKGQSLTGEDLDKLGDAMVKGYESLFSRLDHNGREKAQYNFADNVKKLIGLAEYCEDLVNKHGLGQSSEVSAPKGPSDSEMKVESENEK
jgi:hypothetical protein